MKIFFLFVKIILLTANCLLPATSFAQSSWSVNPFDQKVFIENKGQFDGKNGNEAVKILFSTSCKEVDLYFNSSGLTCKHTEMLPMTEEEKDKFKSTQAMSEKEGEEKGMMKSIPHYLSIEWIGSNFDGAVIAEGPVSFYYTYGGIDKETTATIRANAYKKIIYKNMYPNIDVEYTLPENRLGIKCSFIVHDGANLPSVEMRYSNADKITVDEQGAIRLTAPFGYILDPVPAVYDGQGIIIKSVYVVKGNVVSIKLMPTKE